MAKQKPQRQPKQQGQQTAGFSPAEQRMIEQINLYAQEIIHGKSTDAITQRLQASQDPVESMAMVGAELVKTIERVVEDAIGQELPEGILYVAGVQVINELVEVGMAMQLFDEAQAEDIGSRAFIEAVRIYAEETRQAGEVSDQRRGILQNDVAMLQGEQGQPTQPAEQPMQQAPAVPPGQMV